MRLELWNGNWKDWAKGMGIIVVTAYLFYENLMFAIPMLPYLFFYVREKSHIRKQEERLKRTEEFKDGMISVSFALHVGYSVENAFKEATLELERVYGKQSITVNQFKEIVRRMNQNETLEDLLDEYGKTSGIEDILYFAEVFRFAKRSGGNLIGIIQNTAVTIREKTEVSRQIQTVVSGKKMEQRIMSLIPYGMIAYLKLTSPELIGQLYGNIVGVVIMTVCFLILVGADCWAKRIVNIEV